MIDLDKILTTENIAIYHIWIEQNKHDTFIEALQDALHTVLVEREVLLDLHQQTLEHATLKRATHPYADIQDVLEKAGKIKS